jgi:hypothetical protein
MVCYPATMPASPSRKPWLTRVEHRLPELYLVFALAITGLMCFATAPFFSPDEPAHSLRVLSLAHGILVPQIGPKEAGAPTDAGAIQAMDRVDTLRMAWEKVNLDWLDRGYGGMSEAEERPIDGIRWAHRIIFEPFGNTAIYPPGLYLPAIVGWRIGEAADLTIVHSLRLARLLSAITAVMLGWLALRLAASRWLVLPFLIIPSTLFLNATSSQDSILLPFAALIAALLTRPLAAGRALTNTELTFAALLIALCGMGRPPYAALVLVLFLPTVELRHRVSRDWLRPGVATAAVLAACAAWRALVRPLGVDTADWANPPLQIAFMREHPFLATAAIADGTRFGAYDLFHRGLYVIGWNDRLPHHGAAFVLTLCMATILLFTPYFPLRWPARTLLAVTVAAPLVGISVAEYVIWTPPGMTTAFGIQARYWLPLVPLASMLVASIPLGRIRSRRGPLIAATAVLAAIAATLPWMAAHAFYRDSLGHVLRFTLRP